MLDIYSKNVSSTIDSERVGGGETRWEKDVVSEPKCYNQSLLRTRMKVAHEFIEQNYLVDRIIMLKNQGITKINRTSFPEKLIGEDVLHTKECADMINNLLIFYIQGLKIKVVNNCLDENGFPILTIN